MAVSLRGEIVVGGQAAELALHEYAGLVEVGRRDRGQRDARVAGDRPGRSAGELRDAAGLCGLVVALAKPDDARRGFADRDPNPGRGLRVEPEVIQLARRDGVVRADPRRDRQDAERVHERACGTETLADLRDRGFHRRVGVVSLLVCLQPRDHRGVLALELVAEASTGQRGVDRPAGEDRVDRLSAGRGRAPHPALSLGAVEVLGETQRRVDVREQPRRAELDRDRSLLEVVRVRGDQGRDRLPRRQRARAGSCESRWSAGCRVAHPPACRRASPPRGWSPAGSAPCSRICAKPRMLASVLARLASNDSGSGSRSGSRSPIARVTSTDISRARGGELAGDRPQHLIPGAPLPAVLRAAPLRLHAPNRTRARRLGDCRGMRQTAREIRLAGRDGSCPRWRPRGHRTSATADRGTVRHNTPRSHRHP